MRLHSPTIEPGSAPTRPDTGIRLADLVAAFSLATDLGLGQPMEHALRSWLIASRFGALMDLEGEARQDLFYVVTLAWVGCVADTPEVARWFGDDVAFRRDSFGVDRAGMPMMAYSLRHVGVGSPLVHRLRLGAALVATGGAAIERGLMVPLHLDRDHGSAPRARRCGRRAAEAGVHPVGRKRCARRDRR